MKMKNKSIFLTIILFMIVTACNFPDNQPIIESIAKSSEEIQSIPEVAQVDQDELFGKSKSVNNDTRGYILFAPLRSTTTYLINYDGDVIHTWPGDYFPGNAVYLLGNGNLLRTGSLRNNTFDAGGAGGIVQEIDWNGNVLWEFSYSNDQYRLHHDVEYLPNGNILMIAWEHKTAAEAIAAGRDPNLLKDGALWPDMLIEVDPATNQIVWEWHVWDHLVQDYDPTKANYGSPSEHPELVDINHAAMNVADWNHINSVDFNPELDQILLSVHNFNEIWIIDHNTNTAESAGPDGDLLYRWGNPQAYDVGTSADQQLFVQHDAQWIEPELPGEEDILIFNNGDRRSRSYSSIEEITPLLTAEGIYSLMAGRAYGPAAPIWSYVAATATDFYAQNISGVQRLPSGNTLICDGPSGRFFEVTSAGETVWEYVNPFGQSAPGIGGNTGGAGKMVFRAVYYPTDYTGLVGRDLNVDLNVTADQSGNDQNQNQSSPQGAQAQDLGGQRQPPQAAINACSTLSQGDACTFNTPRGAFAGTCSAVQTHLACKPQGGPPGN